MSEEEEEKEEKGKEIEPAAAGAEKTQFKIPPPSQEKKGIGQEIKEDIKRATPGIVENAAVLLIFFGACAILVLPPIVISNALTYKVPYTTWWGQTYYETVYPPIWALYVSLCVSSALACAFFTKLAVEGIAKVPIKRTSYVYRTIANLILPLAFFYFIWRDIKQSVILAQAGTRTGAELKAPQVPTTVRTYATREATLGDLEDIVQGAPKTAEEEEEEEKEKKREGTKE